MRRVFTTLIEALFRVLFNYDCLGEENLPTSGPAVVAANHPSYLDPVLLSLQVRRPIRFMAWDALFRVPLLGALIRTFGAFPVDIRRGKGREAYERAKALVVSGEVVGLFPEGHRSRTGWMEPHLREGAARLSWETGALLVPATIAGAYRAWPHFQALPRPARIRVRYHEAIDPAPYRGQPEEVALPALLAELQRRVDRSLQPGVKADLRMMLLYAAPAPLPRAHEVAAAALVAIVLLLHGRGPASLLPSAAYLGYLGLDWRFVPQSRLAKWIRNVSPVVLLLASGPALLRALGSPPVPAGAALVAILAGAIYPYVYARRRTAMTFLRGMVLAFALEGAAQALWPSPAGPHAALALYAAAFAIAARTVFWRYAGVILVLYAIGAPLLIGWSVGLSLHLLAGLVAAAVALAFPYHLRAGNLSSAVSLAPAEPIE
ncbi:MAG TPA: lysophospholipid acyltransferase family protein [Vicinamibacteria bacterium]|nr:lysophospholipid acyltransferase family protein [Vicinamibacteria bacterium]